MSHGFGEKKHVDVHFSHDVLLAPGSHLQWQRKLYVFMSVFITFDWAQFMISLNVCLENI